jgi:3D (Asp-Asp-Asp) domain-containing protein
MWKIKSCRINRMSQTATLSSRLMGAVTVCFLLLIWQHNAEGDPVEARNFVPLPSSPMEFEATAYCDAGITKSGVPVAPGIVAADPNVLPLGSLIKLEDTSYRGIYKVLDTGGLVKGRIIDIYMPGLDEAIVFGRRKVTLVVLRYGLPKPKFMPSVLTD